LGQAGTEIFLQMGLDSQMTDLPVRQYFRLALQLPFCFEVRALSDRLVSSTPE
jgi:hypothetical protein